jgi:glycerol-3-phosphate dehydrogenase (NAD(P)+)
MLRIGIIGGGAFGTAMACVLRRSGHAVTLWVREPGLAAAINRRHENDAFLPGVRLDPAITASEDTAFVGQSDLLLMATPAQHLRRMAAEISPRVKPGMPVVSCSKGIETASLALMPEVLAEVLPQAKIAVLSGPSFAREIAAYLPCGVALAAEDLALSKKLAGELGNPRFSLHPGDDVTGVALGGVMKNVVAIAAGAAIGRKLGENARATLVALGLGEAARLGAAKGARAETFLGLAGAGDMMLTAGSLGSRNTSLGVAIGEGRKAAAILAERHEVTEGALSAGAIVRLARRLGVDAPLAAAVDRMVNRAASAEAALGPLFAARGERP